MDALDFMKDTHTHTLMLTFSGHDKNPLTTF